MMAAIDTTSAPTDRHALLFAETQRFTQTWLWLLILGIAGWSWFGAYRELVLDQPNGARPPSDGGAIVSLLLVGIVLPLAFAAMNLRTEVRLDGVYIRFFPLHLRFRRWRWDEIASAESRTYRPIREYGGWGIRFRRKGMAYNVSGNQGVELKLRSGKTIMIGTRQPDRLSAAIRDRMRP